MSYVSSYSVIGGNNICIEDDKPMSLSSANSENKLANISWVSRIEEELGDQLVEEPMMYLSIEQSSESAELKNDTLSDSLDEESDLSVLGDLLTAMTGVKKTIKQHMDRQIINKDSSKFNFDICIESLEWGESITQQFEKKLKLKRVDHSGVQKHSIIPRSSYKFCDFGTDCNYNYNHAKFDGCFSQHFVYNYLRADIAALLKYIEDNRDKKIKFIEMLTCMNTICYVVSHMKDEYSGILTYYAKNIDQMHQERKPVESKRPKIRIKHTKD